MQYKKKKEVNVILTKNAKVNENAVFLEFVVEKVIARMIQKRLRILHSVILMKRKMS